MLTWHLILKVVGSFCILTGVILGSVFLFQLNTTTEYLAVTGDGTTTLDGLTIEEYVNSIPLTEITAAENESLNFMREEEKLAFDVYETLYIKWGTNIFNNIKKAELTHMDAVKILLDNLLVLVLLF